MIAFAPTTASLQSFALPSGAPSAQDSSPFRARLEFARDRQRFFTAAESQVVRLALAIASDVLAREIRGRDLYLADAVKSALARLQSSSETTLKVPVHEVEPWAAMFERESVGKVAVVGDVAMKSGECMLETTVGRVEFGVGIQLAETERKFAHLLQDQPGVKDAPGPQDEPGCRVSRSSVSSSLPQDAGSE